MLLRKLLGSIRKWQITTTVLLGFTVAWGLAAFFVNIFQCWPPQYFWLRHSVYLRDSVDGTCMSGQTAFYISIGALSLVEDVCLLLLPIAVVWRLKLSTKQKLHTTALFSIGGLWVFSNLFSSLVNYIRYRVCIFSLLRILEFKNYLKVKTTCESEIPHLTKQADPKYSQRLQRSPVDCS